MSQVLIGAVKNKNSELISRINKLISRYKVNFLDSRVESSWNKEASELINKATLNLKAIKADSNYIKKVKYDNFEILKYYLKRLDK